MIGFLWMIFWLLSLWSLGALILKWSFWRLADNVRSDVLKSVLMFSVGLIIYSFFWYGLGLLGLIGYPALIFWGCASAVVVVKMRSDLIKNVKTIFVNAKSFLESDRSLRVPFFLIVSLMFVTGLRCWSAYVDGDSLVYHLYLPKLWAIMGGIGNFSFSEHALWPSFLEVCFIPAELIGSLAASKIVSFFLYAFLVISVGSYVFERTRHPSGAMIASASLASIPFLFRHAPSTYNDIAFGYFAILSLIVLTLNLKEPDRKGSWGAGMLAGVLMGASLSCKYIGFYALFAVSGACLLDLLATRTKTFSGKTAIGFFLGTLITGFPYYLRSYLQYHNPVFPFAQKIFNTSFGFGLPSAGLIAPRAAHSFVGTGTSFFDFLALPFSLVFHPGPFGNEKVGIFFLLFLPFLFLNSRKNRFFFFFCAIYAAIWFSLYQGTRYLTPVFPVLAIMLGMGWAASGSSRSKIFQALKIAAVVLLGVSSLWAAYYAYKDFFVNQNRGLIEASRRANSEIGDKLAKILVVGEERVYYYDFVAVRERGFRNFTFFPDLNPDRVKQLLEREGISRILIASPASWQGGGFSGDGPKFDPLTYFREFVKVNRMQKLAEWNGADAIVYQLYQLTNDPKRDFKR